MLHACTCTCSDVDVKELEKAIVSLVKAENADIKQKQDMARLHIHHCQMVLVNAYNQGGSNVKDSPLTQVGSHLVAESALQEGFCVTYHICHQ